MYHQLLSLKEAQNAKTPEAFKKVMQGLYFNRRSMYDPCPPRHQIDGLTSDWKGHNFVNPPFGDAAVWINKAVYESKKNKHSVLLLPAKVSNNYYYYMLPLATSIVFWCNSFKFVGFDIKYPFGMCTIEFGNTGLPKTVSKAWVSPCVDVELICVPADAWKFSPLTTVDKVKAKLQHHYGAMPECTLKAMPRSGKAWMVIINDNQGTLESIARHCVTHKNACVIVVARLAFDGKFRKEHINNLVQHIAILSPSVSLDNKMRSSVSSHVVCMSTKPVIYRHQELKSMPRVWLARYTKEHIIQDYKP